MKLYRRWIESHKQKRFRIGYQWARDAYYIEGKSLDDIKNILFNPFNKTEFDKGAGEALRELMYETNTRR